MAKYTIELGTIDKSKGSCIFDFDYDFYEPQLKAKFERKFIDYYYYDEIGFETIQRFKNRLKAKLNTIMPTYTQLYRTEVEAEDINFLLNKDLTETTIRNKNTNDTSDLSGTNGGVSSSKESNLDNGNATLSQADLTSIGEERTDTTNTAKGVASGTEREELTYKSQGNIGVTSSAELLEKWRKTIINIDEQIIKECKILFMEVY